MAYSYDYPHPVVTVDVIVFTAESGILKVLLVRRSQWPHTGKWAIPGGFVGMDESLRRAALRELREETGVAAGTLEQLGAFGRPDRDPRERVITIAYVALIPHDRLQPRAGSDAGDAGLFDIRKLPELAFDHTRILERARHRLRDTLELADIAMSLMPASFTLSELQRVYEAVTGIRPDKRNFRKRLKSLELLVPAEGQRREGPHRPAQLYRICPNA